MINIGAVYILLFIGTVSMSSEEDEKLMLLLLIVLIYSKPLMKIKN